MAWKEYWLKELQKSMDRCTGHRDISEILLKMALKHHTINQPLPNIKISDMTKLEVYAEEKLILLK